MIPLNLPAYAYKIKKLADKICIFDNIRKKYVVLTPEEWVRQHFISYMIGHLKYPKMLIKVESGLRYNTLAKRSDIILYGRDGLPWMLIECKAPDQKINQLVAQQASVYNTTIQAPYVALTNGLRHVCWRVDHVDPSIELLTDFPPYV